MYQSNPHVFGTIGMVYHKYWQSYSENFPMGSMAKSYMIEFRILLGHILRGPMQLYQSIGEQNSISAYSRANQTITARIFPLPLPYILLFYF